MYHKFKINFQHTFMYLFVLYNKIWCMVHASCMAVVIFSPLTHNLCAVNSKSQVGLMLCVTHIVFFLLHVPYTRKNKFYLLRIYYVVVLVSTSYWWSVWKKNPFLSLSFHIPSLLPSLPKYPDVTICLWFSLEHHFYWKVLWYSIVYVKCFSFMLPYK